MDIYSLTLKKNTEEKIHIKSSGEELGAFSHPNTSIPSLRERKNSGKSYGKKSINTRYFKMYRSFVHLIHTFQKTVSN